MRSNLHLSDPSVTSKAAAAAAFNGAPCAYGGFNTSDTDRESSYQTRPSITLPSIVHSLLPIVEELLPVGLAVVVVFPVVVGFLVDDGLAVVLCVVVAWPVVLDFFVVLVGLAVVFVFFPALMGQCQQGLREDEGMAYWSSYSWSA